MKKIACFKHWLKLCYVTACVAHNKPEPHYHKRNIVKECLFKQSIEKVCTQERKHTRVSIVFKCFFLQKQMLSCVLCKTKTEYTENNKSKHTC